MIDLDPDDLAKKLTMRGLEVESIEQYGASFAGVVVAEITEMEKHPETPNLSVCKVSTGHETLSVVCGAQNIMVGQKVPLATIGGRLSDGTAIEKRVLRGVESLGTLCSERELGLSEDHTGIFILSGESRLGTDLKDLPGIKDSVFDINVPPNRGDCLSMYGIAREVGSIINQRPKAPSFKLQLDVPENISDYLSLNVVDTEACPRYVLRMIKDISIVRSPFWMRSRITRAGMRPINSIVDVTNYVMIELGQPLHAFDYSLLRDSQIEVRLAEHELRFRTLDSVERRLLPGDILICDGKGPVAVAGIMGGENSEISETTKDVALESAYFSPLHIRKTSRRLGIKSEASLRFEKGIDIDNVDFAAKRAIFLMRSLSGGSVVRGKQEVHKPKKLRNIFVSFGKINGILGTYVEQRDITSALRSIGLRVLKEEEAGFIIAVPRFRHDLEEYTDIIEEVARIYGYEKIQATTPVSTLGGLKKERKDTYLRAVKDYFRAAGFFEIINFAFFTPKDAENFLISPSDKRSSFVRIMNPISKDAEVMRTFMAAHMLRTIAYNINHGARNLRFFETGKVFLARSDGLPIEHRSLCFALTGKERDYFWKETCPEYDFFDIKGVLEGLTRHFMVDFSVDRSIEPFLNSNKSADISINGSKAGWIGEISNQVLNAYEIEQKVYCGEIEFEALLERGIIEYKYQPIPRYPQATRDFSFFVDDAIPVSGLMDRIRKVSPLIRSVGIFDMFKKETRSVSFRVIFQSFDDTLTDDIINSLQETIIKDLTDIKGVTLRT